LCFFVIFRGELIDFGFLLESGMLYLKEKKKVTAAG